MRRHSVVIAVVVAGVAIYELGKPTNTFNQNAQFGTSDVHDAAADQARNDFSCRFYGYRPDTRPRLHR